MLITNTRGLSNQGWKELQKLEKKHNESVEQRLGLLLVALGLNCITEATIAEAKYRHRIFSGLVWEGEDVYYDDYFNYWDKVFLKLIGFGVNGLFKTRTKWISGLIKNYHTSTLMVDQRKFDESNKKYLEDLKNNT